MTNIIKALIILFLVTTWAIIHYSPAPAAPYTSHPFENPVPDPVPLPPIITDTIDGKPVIVTLYTKPGNTLCGIKFEPETIPPETILKAVQKEVAEAEAKP